MSSFSVNIVKQARKFFAFSGVRYILTNKKTYFEGRLGQKGRPRNEADGRKAHFAGERGYGKLNLVVVNACSENWVDSRNRSHEE
jgi:hypothetical protein